jgi:hypothetical protein
MAADERNRQIGENVHELRGSVPQETVAAGMRERGHAKWSQSTVWSVETGSRPLRLTEAEDLAKVLGRGTTVEGLLQPPAQAAVQLALYGAASDVVELWRQVRADCRALTEAKRTLEEVVAAHPGSTFSEQVVGAVGMARSCTVETAAFGDDDDG